MLSRGSRGDQVENIQGLLSQVGLYQGPIYGVYDAATEAGVKQLQRANGLKVDGIWGPVTNQKTIDVLSAYNAGPIPPAQPVYPNLGGVA